MQNATDAAPHVHFAVLGERRNGIDRLSLLGSLDRSTIHLLEDEVAGVAHADGALVLDLHNLDAVDIGAVRALQEMARRAVVEGWLLFIVHSRESVREAFVREGPPISLCADVSAVLSPGDGDGRRSRCPPCPGSGEHDTAPDGREATMSDWREQEVVNETRSREINEWIDESNESDGGASPFVCECSDGGCTSTIALTHLEYEEIAPTGRLRDRDGPREPGPGLLVAERIGFAIIGSSRACRQGSLRRRIRADRVDHVEGQDRPRSGAGVPSGARSSLGARAPRAVPDADVRPMGRTRLRVG